MGEEEELKLERMPFFRILNFSLEHFSSDFFSLCAYRLCYPLIAGALRASVSNRVYDNDKQIVSDATRCSRSVRFESANKLTSNEL